MNKSDKLIISYWKEVNQHLNCGRQLRKALRIDTTHHIEQSMREDTVDTREQLVEAFGKPKDFAENLMAGLEQSEIQADIKRRRAIGYGIIICAVLVVLGLSILAIYLKLNQNQTDVVKETIIYAEETPSDFWDLPDGSVLEEGEGVEVSTE